MLKVLHLISTLDIGGAEMQLAKLLTRADSAKFQTSVVCLIEIGSVGEKIRAQGVPVYSLGMKRSVPSLSAIWKLRKLIALERPEILQTWLYHADLLGLIVGKLAGVPSLVWNVRCSRLDMQRYPKLSKLVLNILVRLSMIPDAVIANSESGRAAHIKIGYRPKRFEIISNGFELDRFRPNESAREWLRRELQISEDDTIIGLVARYDPMKDHKTFLSAAAMVHERHRKAYFVLCGTGVNSDNVQLNELIELYEIRKHVRVLGVRLDTESITAGFDIACSSSAFGEGFSNAIAEAMACGVPCVVTDVGDSSHIVGFTGKVVPPQNANALADALCELIEVGPAIRKELGKKARARIAERYDINAMAAKYDKLYLSLCRQTSHDLATQTCAKIHDTDQRPRVT
jgi:glycosyltransferase involved in cell wall biosynthesis